MSHRQFRVRQVYSSGNRPECDTDWVIADGDSGSTTRMYWYHTTGTLNPRFKERDCTFHTKEEAETAFITAKLRGDI